MFTRKIAAFWLARLLAKDSDAMDSIPAVASAISEAVVRVESEMGHAHATMLEVYDECIALAERDLEAAVNMLAAERSSIDDRIATAVYEAVMATHEEGDAALVEESERHQSTRGALNIVLKELEKSRAAEKALREQLGSRSPVR